MFSKKKYSLPFTVTKYYFTRKFVTIKKNKKWQKVAKKWQIHCPFYAKTPDFEKKAPLEQKFLF
tara:strand:+ start:549 stop:740 length:192 start_codon:yes stop_codon:yes gene_type:complete